MHQIIKRYCENEKPNGLLLLDMPTGSGKTYSVVKYIFDAVQDSNKKQKFFFVTTLKKNLPEGELRKHFEAAGQSQQIREKFLRVESNSESVLAGYKAGIAKTIPQSIKRTEEYRALEQSIHLVTNLREDGRGSLRSALKEAENILRQNAEPRFRKMLQALLAKRFSTVEERLQTIKTDKEWQWVATMYPAVFMRERQIIFMSMDKFLVPNSTIVEPPTMLYNSNMLKDAVIFIDEFDATKETVLKTIIENGLKDRIDCVELFNTVYSALHTHTFPAILTISSKKRQEGRYGRQPLQNILDKTTQIADEIHDTFSLQYSHKTERVIDENTNNFLFQDHQYHSILNGNKTYITSVVKPREKINEIRFSNERPTTDEGNVQIMLGKLRGFVSFFMLAVSILASNYQQCKAEWRKPGEDEFTLEEAVRTVLSEFKLPNIYINHLTSQILVASRRYRNEIQSADFDLTVYEKGFRYYAFEDDYAHDMQSKIMMYSFQVTPEKLLLRFCEKAKVLGISATATIPSAIGNYDIEYLRDRLQDRYVTINDEERQRLQISFERATNGYDKVNIHTKLIGCSQYAVAAWKEVAENEEMAQYLYGLVEKACPDDDQDYNKKRYLRIATVFKAFLLEGRIQSFLCVLTKHPRKKDKYLDLDVLLDLFQKIARWYSIPFPVEKSVVQLDGDEYDARKDEIIHRLGKGERLFVISVYQTIGAGQNLQHPAPEARKSDLVAINGRPTSGYKDFDAIYLDKPTHLLTQLSPNLEEREFARCLFQIEMLQEAGEVSIQDATTHIKKAFRCYSSKKVKKEWISKKINNCPSVIRLSTRVIIQAVGRMCRTNLKSKNIYLFADSSIAQRIDYDVCCGRTFNREFVELLTALKEASNGYIEEQDDELRNVAQLKSSRTNSKIRGLLRERWTDSNIMLWRELREMVLTYPTLSAAQFDGNGIAFSSYLEMPCDGNRIYYTQQEDYDKVQVFFERESGLQEVSAEASKLTKLMKIDFLRKHFEKHKWATSFAPNKYIMSPPLFNNIYRGALGEVVGKALFYRYAGVELIEIEDNDLFEKFDYIVPNTSIFLDFKNWHESSVARSDVEKRHIVKKARECGCRCVLVANLIVEGNYAIQDTEIDGVRIVVIPALLSGEETPQPVHAAWKKIGECIDEYADSDQSSEN